MSELQQWFQHLKQPEYVHVLLNPLPVYATAMGVVALAVALILRSRQAQIAAVIVVLTGCGSILPVMHYGERGLDRVSAMSNADARKWLGEHEGRAEEVEFVFYLTALLAIAALVIPTKWPKVRQALTIATLAGAVACVGCGAWIGHAGGQIRHSEFRDGPPPDAAEHHEGEQ